MTELYNLEVILRAKAEGLAAFKEAESGLGGVLHAALAVGTVAVTAVVAFAAASLAHFEEAGHAAFEMADKFGLLPTQASAWMAAANAVGVSNESMSTGFKFAAKNMEAINLALTNGQKPTKNLVEAYAALGVQIYDQQGKLRPLNELMLDAADAFQRMPEGAERAGLAVKLFGRSGTDLLPILGQGRAGIQAYMEAGRASGAVMSNEQVAAAQKLFLVHKQLDQAVAGLANRLSVALLPSITQLINWVMATGVPALEKWWAQVSKIIPPIQQWAAQMWEQLRPALQDIMKRSGDFVPILEAVAIVIGVLIIVLVNVVVGLVRFVDWILQTYDKIVVFRTAVVDLINNGLVGLASGIAGVVGWFRELWSWASNAADAISNVVRNIPGAGILQGLGIPGFASGGIVPGPAGAPMLAIVHGGERVQTPEQQGSSGSRTIYITQNVYGSVMQERELAFSLRETIRRLDREQR